MKLKGHNAIEKIKKKELLDPSSSFLPKDYNKSQHPGFMSDKSRRC